MIMETIFHQLNMAGKVRNAPRITFTGDSEQNFDNPVPKNAAAMPLDFSFALSTLVLVYIVAKSALKLVTNSATSPTDTIELLPNEPMLWHAKGYGTCPFTKDVTGLFVTNPNAGDVDLEIHVLKMNPVPAGQSPAPVAAQAPPAAKSPAPPAVSKVEPKPVPAPAAEKSAAPVEQAKPAADVKPAPQPAAAEKPATQAPPANGPSQAPPTK
jgi:hypothetical protein